MRIAVWRTGHEIADWVAKSVAEGLRHSGNIADEFTAEISHAPNVIDVPDIHIGYGILRGMDEVFRECDRQGKPWFNIDRGYWKPGHYDGYYRVSLRGTQQTGGWPEPDYERWERLGLEIFSDHVLMATSKFGPSNLICSPTQYVGDFFRIDKFKLNLNPTRPNLFRAKDCPRKLEDDLRETAEVYTFNSSVGWEALRRGIPVESDPVHSIVGAWAKTHDLMATRRELFATMAAMQLTLDEMRSGQLWPLMQKLLDVSKHHAV